MRFFGYEEDLRDVITADYEEAYAELTEADKDYIKDVLNGFETPLAEYPNRNYRIIEVACPEAECQNGSVPCFCVGTKFPGVDWECRYCGGSGKVACGKCYGAGSIRIPLEELSDEF